jgi:hypothetical protein
MPPKKCSNFSLTPLAQFLSLGTHTEQIIIQMKTKALLLAAAFTAAGVATSMAQVYSVNAVGYVNVNVDPGFNMVSNPLNAADNSIQSLFRNFQGTIPGGLKVYPFDPTTGQFVTIQWNDLDNQFDPVADAARTVTPGNGVFVQNPSASQLKLTFVGEVPQGQLSNPLPRGFSIKASQVPQDGRPDALGLPGQGGDKIYRYNKATKAYDTYTFNDLDNQWESTAGPGLPVIPVGESFFLFRAQSAGTWTRTFSVNNPT